VRTTAAELAREVGVDESIADEVVLRLTRLHLVTEEETALIVADVGRLQDFLEFLEMPQKFGGES
jgi:CRP/FNR family cyclic AMP-dependent transcriptional regulator